MQRSIVHALFETADRLGDRPALQQKVRGAWQKTTWRRYAERVGNAARGLIALGLKPGQAVCLVGWNTPEWVITDLAIMAAGGVATPLYANLTPEQAAHIVNHSEAAILLADTAEQIDKIRNAPGVTLERLVQLEGEPRGEAVLSFAALEKLGAEQPQEVLDQRLAGLEPTGLATLIYTSGTTGPPKGVMLTHQNLVFTALAAANMVGVGPDDEAISYLPLSHIAEQILTIHGPAVCGSRVAFAESLEQLGDNLREVRPTIFLAVPRVWEKIQARMVAAGKANPPLKRRIAAWARRVGLKATRRAERGESPPWSYALANRLVFSKVRERVGLDRARFCVTATAPIAPANLEFFFSLGVSIYEIYGMTETSGPHTVSLPSAFRMGSAGKPMGGCELKIAADGEILMRGGNAFVGYYKDDAHTAETIDAEGWVHSGDIGELDADGFVRITDRKKDLLITSGGKNVAPQNIEALLKALPGIGQACVVGDRRKHLSALLTVDRENATSIAQECGAATTEPEALAVDPAFIAHVQREMDAMNGQLARFETIKRFVILPKELTVEGGELTPTMKMKRKVVHERYAVQIDSMYEDEGLDEGASPS